MPLLYNIPNICRMLLRFQALALTGANGLSQGGTVLLRVYWSSRSSKDLGFQVLLLVPEVEPGPHTRKPGALPLSQLSSGLYPLACHKLHHALCFIAVAGTTEIAAVFNMSKLEMFLK